MSQHIFEGDNERVVLGYDRPLDYVFCTVERGGEVIYSNLSDENAGTEQREIRYFRKVLDRLGATVPEEMFVAVESDRRSKVGNRVVHYPRNPTLDASEWAQIVEALKSKREAAVTQGRDRAYLEEIRHVIGDGEQASLNEQDWAEIYYALVDGDVADQAIVEKIGPDGKNMIAVTCACGAIMADNVCSNPECRFNVQD